MKAVFVGAAVFLGGCSFASDTLWPALSGDEGEPPARRQDAAPADPVVLAPPPQRASQEIGAPMLASPAPSGTFVGQKTEQLRAELRKLQGKLQSQNDGLIQIRAQTTQTAQRYHGTVAAVAAKLQLGTTPGNPVLVSQWNAAQAELDQMSSDIAAMNALANEIAGNASLAFYVLESARAAYTLAGAIDEDHRQLAILEDETNRTVVLIDRLLAEINEDTARQTAYIGGERGNLTTLSRAVKNGELLGTSLFGRGYTTAAVQPAFAASSTPRSGFQSGARQAMVVIRFDRADVAFERALYAAVSRVLSGQPQARFDIVAVTPAAGAYSEVALKRSQAKRNANRVLQSLTDMGMPASRLSLAATTSPSVSANEVHVYVR